MTEQTDDALEELVLGIALTAPSTLWHYTTAEGLLGILSEGALRAGSLDSLNDVSEGRYMSEQVVAALGEHVPDRDRRALKSLLGDAHVEAGALAVACLCEDGDLLGQWRAYTGGRGFAIGFDSAKLARWWTAEKREGVLAPVKYSPEMAASTAGRHASEIAEAWAALFPGGIDKAASASFEAGEVIESDVEELAKDMPEFVAMLRPLLMSAAFHKDSHFSDEREWRLVAALQAPNSPGNVQTRVREGGLASYRAIPFQDTPAAGPIRAIRIGPGLSFPAQRRALSLALQRMGYSGVELLGSAVPIRVV